MVDIEDVSEADVLEVVFYSKAMGSDVRVGIDVELVSVEYDVVKGEVMVVKNMPFDALEGKTVRLDLSADEVQKDDHFGPVIGTSLRLVSV